MSPARCPSSLSRHTTSCAAAIWLSPSARSSLRRPSVWPLAEYGRQSWAIGGVLPTFLAASSVSVAQVLFSLTGFILFYSALLIVDLILMRKYIFMGPVKALGLEVVPGRPAPVPAE